jgi:hypothetical protein
MFESLENQRKEVNNVIGIIIATHADLGQELIQAITLILGKQSNI